MNRFKFKAWHENSGWSKTFGLGGFPTWNEGKIRIPYWADLLKIVQFIEKKDKAGLDIYEGDKFNSNVFLSIDEDRKIKILTGVECTIVFYDCKFCGKWKIEKRKIGNCTISHRAGYIDIPETITIKREL